MKNGTVAVYCWHNMRTSGFCPGFLKLLISSQLQAHFASLEMMWGEEVSRREHQVIKFLIISSASWATFRACGFLGSKVEIDTRIWGVVTSHWHCHFCFHLRATVCSSWGSLRNKSDMFASLDGVAIMLG